MDTSRKFDDEWVSPFESLDKGTVLMETRMFSETRVEPRRACQILTKILYLLHTANEEPLTTQEATNTFFAVTKLFQSNDFAMRRMMYLVIKDLAPLAEDTIIITQSLTKDMNASTSPKGVFRANAIRALCAVTDSSLLGQVERYLKQAVVDKNAVVASAALASGLRLFPQNPDFVRRWSNEVQEAVNHKSSMVPYHAIGLLYEIKKHDRLAISKLVSALQSSLHSIYAHCMLIRYTTQVLSREDLDDDTRKVCMSYIESCLRHKKEMVVYEAARALASLPNLSPRQLGPCISVLQLFLSSPKSLLRFASVRTLSALAQRQPSVVQRCNVDLEALISDTNRNIGTLAITCLLRTGSEAGVERLVKQIGGFMSEITDELKVVVVQSLHSLALKYPSKHRPVITYLSTLLRDEGGYDFKRAIVSIILSIMHEIPDSTEMCLAHLAEFIEDCEFPIIISQVLDVLADKGPSCERPAKYVRYIYNRIILETAPVRASAVSALYQYAVRAPSLRGSVITLMRRCLSDDDDEVRDRTAYFLDQLDNDDMEDTSKVDLKAVALAARMYLQQPSIEPLSSKHIDAAVSTVEADEAKAKLESQRKGTADAEFQDGIPTEVIPAGAPKKDLDAAYMAQYRHYLSTIPALVDMGTLHKSSQPMPLTEKDVEFEVECIKHAFPQHIVLQFNIHSTLADQQLEDTTMQLDLDPDDMPGLTHVTSVPALVPPNARAATFVVLQREEGFPVGPITATLRYNMRGVDVDTGEPDGESYEDEYMVNDVELTIADYMLRTFIDDFSDQWKSLGSDHELTETYALGDDVRTLPQAVRAVADFLCMKACNRSNVIPVDATKHVLLLSGRFASSHAVLASVKLSVAAKQVTIILSVRCEDDETRDEVVHSIA